MDIRCRHCGEPWDHDELHGLATPDEPGRDLDYEQRRIPYDEANALFRELGCGLFDWAWQRIDYHAPKWRRAPQRRCKSAKVDVEKAADAKIVYDLLGDDLDAAASMLED